MNSQSCMCHQQPVMHVPPTASHVCATNSQSCTCHQQPTIYVPPTASHVCATDSQPCMCHQQPVLQKPWTSLWECDVMCLLESSTPNAVQIFTDDVNHCNVNKALSGLQQQVKCTTQGLHAWLALLQHCHLWATQTMTWSVLCAKETTCNKDYMPVG